MTDFKASIEFPDLNTAPSTDAIDQSQLITGDVVYITKQQEVEVPPIYDFPISERQDRSPPLTKEILITEFKSDIVPWNNSYVPILRDNDERTLLAYNGAEEIYKVTVLDQTGNYIDVYREQGVEGHTAAYASDNPPDVNILWADEGMGTYRLGIWVNSNGSLLHLDETVVMPEFPRYGGLYSRGFRDLTVTLAHNYVTEFTDANLVTYETTDTDIITRKVVYSGVGLIDISDPVVVEYDEDTTKVYHNQTLMVDTLTDNITINVDNLATHFRVLYSEGVEAANTMSLSFLNDTFTLGHVGDDVTFTKFNDDDTWFYANQRNNEKGVF